MPLLLASVPAFYFFPTPCMIIAGAVASLFAMVQNVILGIGVSLIFMFTMLGLRIGGFFG